MELIIPDHTMWIQMAIFFATYLVLKQFIFTPYMELIEKRQSMTDGLFQQAKDYSTQAEKMQTDYESYMAEERKKTATWLDSERSQLSSEERSIVQKARDSVGSELDQVRKEVNQQADAAKKELMDQVPEFASQITSTLIGQPVKLTKASQKSPQMGAR